ncbi:hypothetical protein ES703_118165 [subsurface metagenome]
MCRNLPGKYYHGNGIHISRCNAGYGVGCAWSGCYQAYTHSAAGTGITVSSMNRTRLLANQNMTYIGFVEFIKDVDDNTARISKDRVNTFLF